MEISPRKPVFADCSADSLILLAKLKTNAPVKLPKPAEV